MGKTPEIRKLNAILDYAEDKIALFLGGSVSTEDRARADVLQEICRLIAETK